MKTFFLIFLSILQNNDPIIKIEKIKDSYILNKQMDYSLINSSDKNIIYFTGIEVFEKEWIPTVNDVTRPKSKIALYLDLKKSEKINNKINLKSVFYYDRKFNSKKFRLVVFYKLEGDTTKRMQYSKSFTIKK